jgi:starch-binding outer membrane protein, SusD/RagB family
MKHYKIFISVFVLLMFSMSACDDILDQKPVDRYTDAVLWSDINLAQAYLLDTYEGAKIGYRQYMITSVSDESQFRADNLYVRGDLSPEASAPWNVNTNASGSGVAIPGWNHRYQNIQKLNKFLGNIDRAVEAASGSDKENVQAQVDVMKGEALFLRAHAYSELLRTYGGVPLMDKESQIGQDFLSIPRASFKETVDFIVKDCDDAASLLLSKDEMQMGKATDAAALALKSRVTLFAASDLVADGTTNNKYVAYENPNRAALWTAAQSAAKAVIDLGTYELEDMGAPDKAAVAQNFYQFFAAKTLASNEVIWGKMYSQVDGTPNAMNQWNEPGGNTGWNSIGPSQKLVDAFEMEDGSDFYDHFQLDANGYYQNISGKYNHESIYKNRDPRFYGTLLFDSAYWKGRPFDIRTRVTIVGGVETSRSFGYDTRNSDFNADNATYTGYAIRKMLDESLSTSESSINRNTNIFIEFRYAEILLNYAEASIGAGDIGEATTYINMIRARAAMPNFTGDITEALRYERQIELAFENNRWYDMRRWKTLVQELTDNYAISIVQTTEDGDISTTWQKTMLQDRNPVDRMLWIPIPQTEMAKAPQLVQNPGF